MSLVYLDWNATTPPHPEVLDAMRRAADRAWGNPASVHAAGRSARALVEDAREAVAALVGLDPRDVTLTSGGTEANNLSLMSAFQATLAGGGEKESLVVSAIEHPSVLRCAEALEARGVHVERAQPSPSGVVPIEALREAAQRASQAGRLRLVALQAVNHETGVIQRVAEAAALAHASGALLHVDAVQAVGKLAPETWAGADLLAVAAHKIRGPKGIGALATRPGVLIAPLLRGGAQEKGVRPGTQDPLAAAGFTVAARRAKTTPEAYRNLAPLRDALEDALRRAGAEAGSPPLLNGEAPRAPHVSNLSWPGWDGPELCAALDLSGICVSSGSACSAGTADPSPVLTAMGGAKRAKGGVRVSLGEDTTQAALDRAILAWNQVLGRRAAGS